MTDIPLMKCGHSAMSVTKDGKPACPICAPDPRAYEVDDNPPNFEGRRARCSYYGKPTHHNECNFGQEGHAICTCEQPSDPGHLPFFKYLGPGSHQRLCKHCHFIHEGACPTHYRIYHDTDTPKPIPGSQAWAGESFEPEEYEFDEFYCGCHSWN